jgi:hypothetical protein
VQVLGRRSGDEREGAALADELRARSAVVLEAEAGERGDRLVEALRGGDVGDADPEMVDAPVLAQRAVMDGLGAVAVRVEQEPAVVVVAVLRPRAWPPVVPEPGRRAGTPELVDVIT